MVPSPPTGLTVVTYSTQVEVNWVQNPETDIQGYNVYNSTTSGGGLSGYVKLNNTLIETVSQVQQNLISAQQVVQQTGTTRTTTIIDNFEEVNIYSYLHQNLASDVTQFYVVTAVNTSGQESVYSAEIQATPLVISTEVVTIPTRTQNDISLNYITELLTRDPLLDVKPGSVVRQLHVDPNSLEMYWAFVRENFASRAQSFLNLRALDDSNNDRISDPVSSSPYKQLLMSAFFFTTDDQVQTLIDQAFDALASNYGKSRLGATFSTTNVVYYTTSIPSTDLSVALGDTVSTVATETQSSIVFNTLSSGTMSVAQITKYYNQVTQRYELTIPVQAAVAGSSGNVNANTIVNTSTSGFSVTNPASAFGGVNEESNADLADRVQLSFVGLDVGTKYGYERTCIQIPGVRDVIVVGAGDPLMQRDYDEIRQKHVYGKVDIYIRGGENTQTQDNVGFLYDESINQQFTVSVPYSVSPPNPNYMVIETTNVVTTSTPIYMVSSIRNATQGQNYDILGDWMIYDNATLVLKGTGVNVNLASGKILFSNPLTAGNHITANYQYKVQITNETELGSGTSFSMNHFPIAKRSYTIYKNGNALTENTDYTLNTVNGQGTLSVALLISDVLTATYQYIITVSGEVVIASAVGGETSANLAHFPVVESMLFGLDGISLDLDPTNTINASIGMELTDTIYVTHRYRASNPILLQTQPADSIISIIGSVSGTLQAGTNYTFNKVDDVLLEGNSSNAQRTIKILYANGIPVGTLTASSENVVLVNNEYTQLSQYAIDIGSPDVTFIVRQGATLYSVDSDYLLLPESKGNKVQIARSRNSTIPNGTSVEVYYNYGEVLTITYNANPLVDIVQQAVNTSRHITADVLVKEVLETLVDFEISVVLVSGANPSTVKSDISTALSNEFDSLKLGQGVAQSDVISTIESVTNVKSVVVPLTKMTKANGTQINREVIGDVFVPLLMGVVQSYTTGPGALLNSTLGPSANDGFYSIFEDDRPLVLVSTSAAVSSAAGQGFIGVDGTIVISTIDGDSPALHQYTVSYVVNGNTGAEDIEVTSLEYISLGQILITTA
jgi:Baseplate J-like protein